MSDLRETFRQMTIDLQDAAEHDESLRDLALVATAALSGDAFFDFKPEKTTMRGYIKRFLREHGSLFGRSLAGEARGALRFVQGWRDRHQPELKEAFASVAKRRHLADKLAQSLLFGPLMCSREIKRRTPGIPGRNEDSADALTRVQRTVLSALDAFFEDSEPEKLDRRAYFPDPEQLLRDVVAELGAERPDNIVKHGIV